MRYMLLVLSFMCTLTVHAVTVRDDAPARYVVQRGDTLWDIANRFLAHPWDWKTLWHSNPHVSNPNRLYPGAILQLHTYKNNPYLDVLSNGTIKLSPYMRPMPMDDPIPPIPLADIKPFFDASLVLDKDSLSTAPYIVAFKTEHLLGSQGDDVYVKNLCPPVSPQGTAISYAIYRPCGMYTEPKTKETLGYKAILIGYAELVSGGDPATILLTNITRGVRLADRVMPNNYPAFDLFFEPKTSAQTINGSIIDLPGDYSQGAAGLVVAIDRGKNAGLEAGDVLAVYREGKYAPDPKCPNCVKLPDERIGEVMIFRTFSRTSFALVMRSIRAVKISDKVTNP